MKHEKRVHERSTFRGSVTLISSDQEDITATLENISLGGLLISDPSSPVDKNTEYNTKIFSVTLEPIVLSVRYVRQKEQYVGMRITRYHADSIDLLKKLISDFKDTNELVGFLEEGWLEHLFEDDQE